MGAQSIIDAEGWLELQAMCDAHPGSSQLDVATHEQRLLLINLQKSITPPSYWLRVWIMQEIILARHLVIRSGPLYINPDRLYLVLKRFFFDGRSIKLTELSSFVGARGKHTKRTETELQFDSRYQALNLLHNRQEGRLSTGGKRSTSIAHALHIYGNQDCTMRYDAIFGLLGLTRSSLKPDYTMSVFELYLFVLVDSGVRHGDEPKNVSRNYLLFHKALVAALDLQPDNIVVALLQQATGPLFSHHFASHAYYRDVLVEYYCKGHRDSALEAVIVRPYALTRSWMILGRLRFYRSQNMVLSGGDSNYKGRTYDEWMARVEEQIATVQRLPAVDDDTTPGT